MRNLYAILFIFFYAAAFAQHPPVKVACIGASITYGARINDRAQNCYPAQLQRMLGSGYEVTNYGVSGTTLLHNGDKPYRNTPQYQAALAANPGIVVIDLGGE